MLSDALRQWRGIDASEAEHRVREIHQRLEETEHALKVQRKLLNASPKSFAYRLSLQSLINVQVNLKNQLIEVMHHREVELINLAFDGPGFPNHTGKLTTLTKLLSNFQNLYGNLAASMLSGPKSTLPGNLVISDTTQLRLAAIIPSSFGMTLSAPTQADLFGHSLNYSTLDALFSLLAGSQEPDDLVEQAARYGPRVMALYRRLVRSMIRTNSTPKISWKAATGEAMRWTADESTLMRLDARLASIREEQSEEKAAIGKLVGVSLLRNRFEFIEATGSLIEGRIAEGTHESVSEHFNQDCRIIYTEYRVRDQITDRTRTTITLTNISSIQAAAN